IVLRGWPATIFCTAEERYIEELATRSLTVTPSTASEKIVDAMQLKAEEASNPWFTNDVERRADDLRVYISYVAGKGSTFKVVIPYADEIVRIFPGIRTREMRDIAHFMSLIKAATLFNFVRRPYLQVGEDKYLLSTLDDLKLVLSVFQMVRETTEYGLSDKVLTFYHEVVENLKQFDVGEAMLEWNKHHVSDKKSSKTIWRWLQELEAADLVSSQQDPQDRRRILYTVISRNSPEIPLIRRGRRISGLFDYNSFEKWLKKIGTKIGSYKAYSNVVGKQPVDEAKLYSSITKRVCPNYVFGSHFF
ncbi:MAG: hypothetical protein ACP5GW_06610, partial [Caldisericaceae bacterium]